MSTGYIIQELPAFDGLYRFKVAGADWGVVLIDVKQGQVFSQSGWGDYCFMWNAYGDDFMAFVTSLNYDYAYNKFTHGRPHNKHTEAQFKGFWKHVWGPLMAHISGGYVKPQAVLANATNHALAGLCQKLQAFKDYVHTRLDEARVPAFEEQNAINSCRIGARLDEVLKGYHLYRQSTDKFVTVCKGGRRLFLSGGLQRELGIEQGSGVVLHVMEMFIIDLYPDGRNGANIVTVRRSDGLAPIPMEDRAMLLMDYPSLSRRPIRFTLREMEYGPINAMGGRRFVLEQVKRPKTEPMGVGRAGILNGDL